LSEPLSLGYIPSLANTKLDDRRRILRGKHDTLSQYEPFGAQIDVIAEESVTHPTCQAQNKGKIDPPTP
jgi:hypothetical protein